MKPIPVTTPKLAALGAAAALSCMLPLAAPAEPVAAPEQLAAPGTQTVLSLEASGVQIYECRQDAEGKLAWALKAPEADLYDDAGVQEVHHFAGPSWRANDGSQIEGKVLRQAPGDTPSSIAQLLLAAKSVGPDGVLSNVRFVQRLATAGGVAPAQACTTAGQTGRSPYIARYVFLK
jgi:hypothetical protein